MPSPRLMLFLLLCSGLIGPGLGCARSPAMVVAVENVPPDAASLSVFATHQSDSVVQPSLEPLHPYDLPQPAPSQISFLLRLPEGFSGDFTVNVAAMKAAGGDGCLLRSGTTSRMFMPNPLDDAMTVSLKDPASKDPQCTGSPRLFTASPRYGRTAGGDQVTLSGWGFRPGADVYFGDTRAQSVSYGSASSLQVVSPRSAVSGPVSIRVVNSDGSQVVAGQLFQYAYDAISFSHSLVYPTGSQMTDFAYVQLEKPPNDQPDIVYTDTVGAVCTVLMPGNRGKCNPEGSPVSNLGLFDINRDGNLDTVVAIAARDEVSVRTNDGNGDLSKQRSFPVTLGPVTTPITLTTGDVDGDGLADVVTANQTSPVSISVLVNDRNGGLQPPQVFPIKSVTMPAGVAMLDMNGDLRNDLFIVDKMSGRAVLLLNQGSPALFDGNTQGSGYIPLMISVQGGLPPTTLTYDVDGDGRLDLINALESANGVGINISTGQLSANTTGVMATAPRRVAFGDINGDGLADLIVLNGSAQSVDFFLQQLRTLPMDPYFVSPPSYSVPLSSGLGTPVLLGVTDLPAADGKLDVAVIGTRSLGFLLNTSR